MIPNSHDVSVQQSVVIDCYAIDQRSIRGAKVNNKQAMLVRPNFGVMSADV
jgi:hypothetical protein